MTLLVGIRCQGGVVLATDSAATYGAGSTFTIGQQRTQKLFKVGSGMLFCGTGSVGMAQVISYQLGEFWGAEKGLANCTHPADASNRIGTRIGKAVRPYLETAALLHQSGQDVGNSLCKSLVAATVDKKAHLFQFDNNGAPEYALDLKFVALGSGQSLADPFLAYLKELFWRDGLPTLAEGRLAATWTVRHVIRNAPGFVGGDIQLGVLQEVGGGNMPVAEILDPDRVLEHLDNIHAAEEVMVRELRPQRTDVPNPPEPPAK